MMFSHILLTLGFFATLPVLNSAHFILNYPPARGFDEAILGTFPCGGQAQTQNRTAISLTSFPLTLEMGHDRTVIQVLLGLGNDPGSSFNIILKPTFAEQGLGDFCLPHIVIPESLGLVEGMNATLQVVTDGDISGGLYNCADITFTSTTQTIPSSCKNGTGVIASTLPSNEASINANQSSATGGLAGGSSSSGTASAATSTPTGQAVMLTATWGLLGLVIVGVATLM